VGKYFISVHALIRSNLFNVYVLYKIKRHISYLKWHAEEVGTSAAVNHFISTYEKSPRQLRKSVSRLIEATVYTGDSA
jgi:hypothetical protein